MYESVYLAYAKAEAEVLMRKKRACEFIPSFMQQIEEEETKRTVSGFTRMQKCRDALEAIDRQGWQRSFHQKQFHEEFIRASSRVFWKTEAAGMFERDHRAILEFNGWDNLPQEILVSTPRRFGKTISVSMFAAAMIYASPRTEISIYSTCKRISQKLLRNIGAFLAMVFKELGQKPYPMVRDNMEELALQGPEGVQDVRVVNSYPSKVTSFPSISFHSISFVHCKSSKFTTRVRTTADIVFHVSMWCPLPFAAILALNCVAIS